MNKRIKKQFLLSTKDADELKRKAELAGLTETAVVRLLIRGYEPREKPDGRFYEAMRNLSAIGNNINQLAAKAHMLGFIDVQNNEEIQRMIESIHKVGAITPALARPLPGGGYELISGHRRLAACQVLGVETMPVIVRELFDDEAVIAMVDANLQRETILPSVKAFAYKMKLEAIKHQGVAS